jgi:hypothetical protein
MPARTAPTTTRASQSVARRADLAAIHAAAHALGMDHSDPNPEGEYRSMLKRVGGHHSAADMTPEQRDAVKRHLAGLQQRGGQGITQADYVLLLWKQLGELGALKDPSPAGLRNFLESHGKVSHVRMMGPAQGNKVVEALKAWLQRAKGKKA